MIRDMIITTGCPPPLYTMRNIPIRRTDFINTCTRSISPQAQKGRIVRLRLTRPYQARGTDKRARASSRSIRDRNLTGPDWHLQMAMYTSLLPLTATTTQAMDGSSVIMPAVWHLCMHLFQLPMTGAVASG